MTHLGHFHAQRDRQVCFPDARRSEQYDVASVA